MPRAAANRDAPLRGERVADDAADAGHADDQVGSGHGRAVLRSGRWEPVLCGSRGESQAEVPGPHGTAGDFPHNAFNSCRSFSTVSRIRRIAAACFSGSMAFNSEMESAKFRISSWRRSRLVGFFGTSITQLTMVVCF